MVGVQVAVFVSLVGLVACNAPYNDAEVTPYVEELFRWKHLLTPQVLLDPNIQSRGKICNLALARYLGSLVSLNSNSTWAFQMLDSTAKIPEGILYANHEFLGQYDECLAVKSPVPVIKGKHCILRGDLDIHFPGVPAKQKSVFFYGMCVPSICSAADLNSGLWHVGNLTGDLLTITADPDYCHTDKEVPLESGDQVVVAFLSVLGALGLLSTIIDVYYTKYRDNLKPNPLLTSFSLYKNGKTLFNTSEGADQMLCLNGIKVCSIAWIIFFHVFTTTVAGPITNITQAFKARTDNFYAPLAGAYLAVDSFLLISGFLLTLSFFRTMTRSGTYDAPLGYIHRYFRLTPSYAMVLLFQVTIFRYIGDGPMWFFMQNTQTSVCKEYWWTGLLYVQNYVNPNNLCLTQTWYLSADMQLYWISPLVFYPMWKWRKFAPYYIGFLSLASTFLPFALAYTNGFAPVPLMDTTGLQNELDNYPTYSRATPWFIGVALGLFVFELKQRKVKIDLNWYMQAIAWPVAGTIAGLCVFGLISFENDETYKPGVAASFDPAFFLSFHRLGWSLAMAWLIFACINGFGGPINGFLSWSFFIPLGKLTYGVYLSHISVIIYKVGIQRTNMYFNLPELVFLFFAVWVASHLVGMLLYLFIEAPFFIIDRHLLRNTKILPLPPPRKKDVAKNEP